MNAVNPVYFSLKAVGFHLMFGATSQELPDFEGDKQMTWTGLFQVRASSSLLEAYKYKVKWAPARS